jgi:hypothetical protein
MTELYCENTLMFYEDCDCEDCVARREQGAYDTYVEDMAFEDYVAAEGVNASAIKSGVRSMKSMRHYAQNSKKDNAAMSWGRKGHIWTLQYEDRFDLCAVYDGPTEGKGSRTALWAFQEENKDKEILNPDEVERLDEMRAEVMKNKDISRLLSECAKEVVLMWEGTYGKAKARLDLMGADKILDVKFVPESVFDAEGDAFARHIRKSPHYGLIQQGWYKTGFMKHFDVKPKCGFVAIQNAEPWDNAVYWLDDGWVDESAEDAHEIACMYKACELSGVFPGVQRFGPQELDKPVWEKMSNEEDASTGKADEGMKL